MKKYTSNIILITLLLICFSCRKDEIRTPALDVESIKTWDDTLANPENPNIKINAGRERLYMTYGRGSSITPIINGVFLGSTSKITSVVMATDLDGKLIWKNTLPQGLAAVTPIELSDESCIIAAADLFAYNQDIDDKLIYVFHFSSEGIQLSVDSFILPVEFGSDYQLFTLDEINLGNDEILLYGSGIDWNTSITKAFSVRYLLNGGVQSIKPVIFRSDTLSGTTTYIHNCIKTNDGGLMFMGVYQDYFFPVNPDLCKIIVVKTNQNSDTLWTKWFDYLNAPPGNFINPSNIIQLADGRFYLCMNDLTSFEPFIFKGLIYELNEFGDSIGGFSINGPGNVYCSSIIEGNDQNIIALFNQYPNFLYLEFEPFFTQFNTEIYSMDFNLNIKSKITTQTHRTDFFTTSCRTSEGKLALFGLYRTNNHQSYVPGLMLLN